MEHHGVGIIAYEKEDVEMMCVWRVSRKLWTGSVEAGDEEDHDASGKRAVGVRNGQGGCSRVSSPSCPHGAVAGTGALSAWPHMRSRVYACCRGTLGRGWWNGWAGGECETNMNEAVQRGDPVVATQEGTLQPR